MIYLLLPIFIFYIAYTLNFALKFNRTETYLSRYQQLYHNILIWMIPFFWIMILKSVVMPTSGSSKFKKTKARVGFYESGIGIWADSDTYHSDADSGGVDGGND
jgi:hypothetical protein